MRLLAVTFACAIALLSACDKRVTTQVVTGPGDIWLPCNGKGHDAGEWDIGDNPITVVFHTDGRCNFSKATDFSFVGEDGKDPPRGFQRLTVTYPTPTISYDYKGKATAPISTPNGYTFKYENDYAKDGNGSGVVKN